MDIKLQIMKNVLCSLFLLLSAAAISAQTSNVWKGGFPGRVSDWNVGANWSAGRVPEAFDQIVIQDAATTGAFYPEIESGVVNIRQLIIESNARLYIHPGSMLVVDGEGVQETVVLNLGCLQNDGVLRIENDGRPGLDNQGQMEGKGLLIVPKDGAAVAARF
jgi:hypothetical protein